MSEKCSTFIGGMGKMRSYRMQQTCRMFCVVGVLCVVMCGGSSCGWKDAKEVIATAERMDKTEHVVYDDTAAIAGVIRKLDNPLGKLIHKNTLGKAYYFMGRNLEDNYQQVAEAARCYIEADRDGDGYYFWGSGDKPSHCPSCAPDEPDGDDSNPRLTAMNEYGQFLPIIQLTDVVITTNVQWNVNDTLCGDVYIQDNAALTITNANITLHPLSHILVEEGGTLIVDNATILNADIVVNPGGSLVVLNEGILQQGENDNIDVKLGGLMQFETGEIRKFE
mgnify:CR=1 FL=1